MAGRKGRQERGNAVVGEASDDAATKREESDSSGKGGDAGVSEDRKKEMKNEGCFRVRHFIIIKC